MGNQRFHQQIVWLDIHIYFPADFQQEMADHTIELKIIDALYLGMQISQKNLPLHNQNPVMPYGWVSQLLRHIMYHIANGVQLQLGQAGFCGILCKSGLL